MATYIIKIIYKGKFEKNDRQVIPGNLYVSRGDTVIFSSRDTYVEIFFPDQTKYLLKAPNVIEIKAGGHSDPYTIHDIKSDDEKFPYAVYCREDNDFAEGNSCPAMIVEK